MSKDTLIQSMILALMLFLAACSGATGATQVDPEVSAGNNAEDIQATTPDALPQFEFPLSTQLAVGTLALEGTDLAVNSSQAVELALLWKAYRGMANSETTAPEELTALIAQIQEVMSPEQITQISQMSYEDITAVRETLGLEFAFGGRLGTNNQNEEREDGALPDVRQGNFPGGLPQGGFPEGGPGGGPGGGFAGGQGADLDPEQIATLQAERGERAGIGIDRMTLMFLDPLIELLEARAAE